MSASRQARTVLLYSHDTYGLGHLRRNLAIAAHLLTDHPGRQVVLLSGSTVSDHFTLPAGLSVIKLPPVVKVGAETYEPRDSRLSVQLVRRIRTAMIADVACRLRPDVFLVDHSPAGMGGELREVFAELRRRSPRTRIALGLRDIIDEPSAVIATWENQGIQALLDEVYDELYVYGSRDVFDLGAAYRLPRSLQARLVYCGYLDKPAAASTGFADPVVEGPYLLATPGGGGDGTEVLTAAMAAAATAGLQSLVVTGPLMDEADRRQIDMHAAAIPGSRVVTFHPALRDAMAGAAAIVTMGGYNSLCEAVAVAAPTVVVPRTSPRLEQAMRAEHFALRGLVDVVLPGCDLVTRLSAAVVAARGTTRPLRRPLDFGGLDRLGASIDGCANIVERESVLAGRMRQPA